MIGNRTLTLQNLDMNLAKILGSYMIIWDEYYATGSRDSAILKDLADAILGIKAVLEVYARDKNIHPDYALEKLRNSKSYIDYAIRYYESKLEEQNGDNK